MHGLHLLEGRVRTTLVSTQRYVFATVSGRQPTWPGQLRSLRTRRGWQALRHSAFSVLVFAAAYLAGYVYGNGLPSPVPLPAPFWPPDAILLSALLLASPRRWWIYLLITLPIRMVPALAPGVPTWLLVVNWLNDTFIMALLAAVLVRRFAPRPLRFMTLREMGVYLASAVLVAPALSAFVGAAGLATLGTTYWQAWISWFLADALASLVLTPTIVMWVTAGLSGLRPASRQRALEGLLLAVSLLLVAGLFVFTRETLVIENGLYYLSLPLLVWAAVRFGPLGIASALTVITCFAVLSFAGFSGYVISPSTPRDILSLQLFLCAAAVPLLLLAAQIEERKQAVEQVERQAEELDRVFEAVADGIAIYDLDGREMRNNAALQALLRLDIAPPEYAQMSLHERMMLFAARDEQGRPLAPDDGPLPRALAGEVMAGAETMDVRSRTLDGHELQLNVSAAPLHDGAGQLVGVVLVFRDQTERKRLEREVAEQAEQLDRIVEGMGEGLFVYDTQGQVVRMNAAARRLLGLGAAPPDFYQLPAEERIALYTPSERQDSQLLTPEEWLATRALVGSGDALSPTEARDVRLRTMDGRELEVSASVAPLHNPTGQVVGAVLLLSDRTERNQLVREREEARASELALAETKAQMDTFLGIASHELRTPLTSLKLSLQSSQRQLRKLTQGTDGVAATEHAGLQSAVEQLSRTAHQVERMEALVNDLVDVSRIQAGQLELRPEQMDLVAVVADAVTAQREAAPDRRIYLQRPAEDSVPVYADPGRIEQVVTNYLTNALKYSPAERPVEVGIEVEVKAQHVRVWVRDYGQGLPLLEQEHIWERFYRVQGVEVQSGTGVGLGLGLYVSRMIVERHQGQVGVESAPGQGATFWFTLPLTHSE